MIAVSVARDGPLRAVYFRAIVAAGIFDERKAAE
jgi:hypothetical protein